MSFPTTLGLFRFVPSSRLSPSSSTSLPGCPLSSTSLSRPFSVTTGASSIIIPLAPSFSLRVFSSACLVRTLLLRMARLSG
jgi:hypothetical protein